MFKSQIIEAVKKLDFLATKNLLRNNPSLIDTTDRASGDTSKPANEGHLKTGQWKQAGRIFLYPVMVGESKKKFGIPAKLNYTVRT